MNKGFTLIELIIVIIIVGILASVGVTQYTKVVEKGRAAEARMILGALRTAEIAHFNENGTYVAYGAGAETLGVGAPTACATSHYFSYACTGTAAASVCTATRCTAGGKAPQSATAYSKVLDVPTGVWTDTSGY
ncbi:MAG: prepilin-type N-terminal cleavage/methylation domain-containing protein [Candidatus Omnitrophota bacterium]